MKKNIILFLIFISNIIICQDLPFNQASTETIYQSWVNYDTDIRTWDVVNLRGGWDGFSSSCFGLPNSDCFCDQIFSNVSIVPGASGKWYIYGYGDHKLSELSVGDASWLIVRNPDGKYDLVPQCHYSPQHKCFPPVYEKMKPVLQVKPVDGYPWNYVGGMGQRMAVFYSPQADAGGNHYFAIVKITDFGDPVLEPDEKYDDRHYIVWAVSQNGITWLFEKYGANFSNCDNWENYLTEFSNEARPIIYRECFQADNNQSREFGYEVFHHYALYYSDPTKQDIYGNYGDGYVYVIFGYTPSTPGVHNISIRIPFNLSSCVGRDITKPIQIYRDDDYVEGNGPYCSPSGQWENLSFCSNTCDICANFTGEQSDYGGCIPCDLSRDFRSSLFNNFIQGVAVPFDWITLKDKWGNFYGSVIAYDSNTSFGTDRIAIRFTRDIKPPFRWTEEHENYTCNISQNYTTCEAGGNNVGLYQPPYGPGFYDFYDSITGAPKKLIAYFAFRKITNERPYCSTLGCTNESGGILPAVIDLKMFSPLPEVEQLKITKAGGGKLKLTWNPLSGISGYEVLEGTLGRWVTLGQEKEFIRYGMPFNPDGYNNNPSGACPEIVKYDHYRKCSWKDINNNCCTWINKQGKCCNDSDCFNTEPLPIESSPVYLYPEDDDTERYFLVIPYCHRYDQGMSFNYSGVERLAPICQKRCWSRDNIDCWHYYFPNQPYDYGRMHWPQPNQ